MKKAFNRHFAKLLFLFLLTIGFWLILQPNAAIAHNGGEPRLVDVEAGDFRLSVWTLPVPLETGELNFIVFVAESSTEGENAFVRANTPVLDADIELIIEPDGGGEPLVVKPDHEKLPLGGALKSPALLPASLQKSELPAVLQQSSGLSAGIERRASGRRYPRRNRPRNGPHCTPRYLKENEKDEKHNMPEANEAVQHYLDIETRRLKKRKQA